MVVIFKSLHLPENTDSAALFSALAFQHNPAPQRQETGCRLGIRGVLELGVRPKFAGGTKPGFQQGGRERVGFGGLWIDLRNLHGRGGEGTNLGLAGQSVNWRTVRFHHRFSAHVYPFLLLPSPVFLCQIRVTGSRGIP